MTMTTSATTAADATITTSTVVGTRGKKTKMVVKGELGMIADIVGCYCYERMLLLLLCHHERRWR